MSQPTTTPPEQTPPPNPTAPPPNPTPPPTPPPPSSTPPPPSDDQARRDAHNASQSLLDTRAVADLRTEIQALPERMVRAYREAFQPPQTPPPSTNTGSGSASGGNRTPGEGDPNMSAREKFVKWWNG